MFFKEFNLTQQDYSETRNPNDVMCDLKSLTPYAPMIVSFSSSSNDLPLSPVSSGSYLAMISHPVVRKCMLLTPSPCFE